MVNKKDGGEVMLVFPGQRMTTLEPLQILIRQLAILAAKESQDDAERKEEQEGTHTLEL